MARTDASSDDLEALRALLRAEQRAAEAGDVDALMDIRTDDFVSVPPGAPPVEGKEAVRDFLGGMYEAYRPTRADFTFDDVRVSGDLGIGRGTYRMTMVPSAGGEPIEDGGSTLFVAERQEDGSWKLAMAMWNGDAPPSGP